MKTKLFFLGVLISAFFDAEKVYANQKPLDSLGVVLQARPTETSIRLRWIINDAQLWEKSIGTGYTIERYTIRKNGEILDNRIAKILTPNPLNIASESQWAEIAVKNNYAAIIAQALFGDGFEVDGFGNDNIGAALDRNEYLKQKYGFSLYAADMCFDCACLAGWGYEDFDVTKGEYYLYRIIPSGLNEQGYGAQYGFAYTSVDEYKTLPRPIDLTAHFGDHTALLSWNSLFYKEIFTAYKIEKSTDNEHFQEFSMPHTPLNDREFTIFPDSLDENGVTYFYRIRGMDIFGNVSDPSDVVSGKGINILKSIPHFTYTNTIETGGAALFWDIDSTDINLLHSFELLQAASENERFDTIIRNISRSERMVFIDKLKPVNYFKILAKGINGEKNISFPIIVTPIDSIPPKAPLGLTAEIDTAGIVTLNWKANSEDDLAGYKIFRGNIENEELIPLVGEIISKNTFVDTVDLYNVNPRVYYAIKAFDTHFNQSDFSTILSVEKPSRVPPSAPIFRDFASETGSITLFWIPSTDDGVAYHSIYRREINSNEPVKIKSIPVTDTVKYYKDTDIEGNKTYIYTISSHSLWNVESAHSPEYRISSLPENPRKIINKLRAEADYNKSVVSLTWEKPKKANIKSLRFFRSVNNDPPSLWKEISGEETVIKDNLKHAAGNRYVYSVVAKLNDGSISSPETITFNY
jgi:hypothetical protein